MPNHDQPAVTPLGEGGDETLVRDSGSADAEVRNELRFFSEASAAALHALEDSLPPNDPVSLPPQRSDERVVACIDMPHSCERSGCGKPPEFQPRDTFAGARSGAGAEEAGREFDAIVAEKVMGWRWLKWLGDASRLAAYGETGRFLSRGNIAGTEKEDYAAADLGEPLHARAFYLVPRYSTDIAAAWQVVEAMAKRGWIIDVQNRQVYRWACHVGFPAPNYAHVFEVEDTAPHAICVAALKAVEVARQFAAVHPTEDKT